MLILTGKQKRFIRSQANELPAIFSLGKNGISKKWIGEILDAFNSREIIKISIQANSAEEMDQFIDFIHANSQITVVQKIGRTIILYLPNKDDKYQNFSKEVDKLAK
ncbi:MAG: YhbY family RNA-binding protein [Lactobacillaceae bacterium]|jgi:putative YhbY family RNA-binding protein|nr:YhbY family RNA-binding protein [Lactobacillaceae bacterium]